MTSASQRQAARLLAHTCEMQRQIRSGMGCSMGPFIGKSEAELAAEDQRIERLARSPGMVLKRALIKLGTPEAEDLYAAACRGDEGWADRARVLLGPKAQAA